MEYAGIRQLMSAKLQTELDEKTFGSVKNNLRRSYGEQRENRFLAYQRYADGDRLTYLAKYSKEKALLFIFVFDKQNDLGAFSFQPIGEQQHLNRKQQRYFQQKACCCSSDFKK